MKRPTKETGPDGRRDWQRQIEADLRYANQVLIADGGVAQLFVIHTRDATMPILTRGFTSDEKNRVYAVISLLCVSYQAIGLSFISEAWLRSITQRAGETEQEQNERAFAVSPSQAEDRMEIVSVLCLHHDADGNRQCLHRMREIMRDGEGRPFGLREHAEWESSDGSLGGALLDLFPPTPVPDFLAAAAEIVLEDMKLAGLFGVSELSLNVN